MQSDLTEVTQKAPLNQNTLDSHRNSHHGLDRSDEQPSHQLRAGEGNARPRRSTSITSSSTSSSRGSDKSLERSLRGLSSPTDRIAEHEKASSYLPKKRHQGLAFAVIQRGRNATTGQVTLADFPNGLALYMFPLLQSLIDRRGLDTCSISFASIITVGCIISVTPFPSIGHYTSRLEDCLFPLLPRLRKPEHTGLQFPSSGRGPYITRRETSLRPTHSFGFLAKRVHPAYTAPSIFGSRQAC